MSTEGSCEKAIFLNWPKKDVKGLKIRVNKSYKDLFLMRILTWILLLIIFSITPNV